MEASVCRRLGAAGRGRQDVPAHALPVPSCPAHNEPIPVSKPRPPTPPSPASATPHSHPHSAPSPLTRTGSLRNKLLWRCRGSSKETTVTFTSGQRVQAGVQSRGRATNFSVRFCSSDFGFYIFNKENKDSHCCFPLIQSESDGSDWFPGLVYSNSVW